MSALLLIILLSAVLACHYASGVAALKPFVETDPHANAVGIALASFATMVVMAPLSYGLERALLAPYELGYLRTFAIMIVIMTMVPIVAAVMRRSGRWIPIQHAFPILMTTNCTVLGVALLSTMHADSFVDAILLGAATGLAFGIMFLMFTTLQQRLSLANIPLVFRDAPAALITAGLMALAFMGFTGLVRE